MGLVINTDTFTVSNSGLSSQTYGHHCKALVQHILALDSSLSIVATQTDTNTTYSVILSVSGSDMVIRLANSSTYLYLYFGTYSEGSFISSSTSYVQFFYMTSTMNAGAPYAPSTYTVETYAVNGKGLFIRLGRSTVFGYHLFAHALLEEGNVSNTVIFAPQPGSYTGSFVDISNMTRYICEQSAIYQPSITPNEMNISDFPEKMFLYPVRITYTGVNPPLMLPKLCGSTVYSTPSIASTDMYYKEITASNRRFFSVGRYCTLEVT